jgi:hypothetical protein
VVDRACADADLDQLGAGDDAEPPPTDRHDR